MNWTDKANKILIKEVEGGFNWKLYLGTSRKPSCVSPSLYKYGADAKKIAVKFTRLLNIELEIVQKGRITKVFDKFGRFLREE